MELAMARTTGMLTARKVETVTKPGRYADGGNLYLQISGNGGKRWVFCLSLRAEQAGG